MSIFWVFYLLCLGVWTTVQGNVSECGLKYGKDKTGLEWPWMVAIRRRKNSGNHPWCSGFLIDREHVLTTATCVEKKGEGLYSTRIGNVNQDEADEYPVSQITVHESYREGFYQDDIAILKLSREVKDPNIVPICLPDETVMDMVFSGTELTVAGWGLSSHKLESHTDSLRILKVMNDYRFVPNQKCYEKFLNASRGIQRQFPRGFTSGILCAVFPENGKDVCSGYSGGPLMIQDKSNRWFAVGIISFGYSCGIPGMPGAYTRVYEYLDWIRKNTSD